MGAFEDFVNLELPRRPALLTVPIISFDDDPNNPAAPPIIQLAPLGTYYQQENPAVALWRKEPDGTWIEVGAGGSGGAGVRGLVYRENHPDNGPFVFNSFIDFYNALDDLGPDAQKIAVYDDTLVTGVGMGIPPHPDSIPYNFKSTEWHGLTRPGGFSKSEIRLLDGVEIINPPGTFKSIRVVSMSPTNAPLKCVGQESFFVRDGSDLSSNGAAGLFDLSALPGFDYILIECANTGTLSGSNIHTTPIADLLNDKIVLVRVAHGAVNNDCFQGAGGILAYEFWQGGVYSDSNPLFLGTFLENFVFVPPSFQYTPTPITANSTLDVRTGMQPISAAGGPITITLPPYSSVFKNPGYLQCLKETSGANEVILQAPAGGSINGVSGGSYTLPPLGGCMLGGDGLGNYLIFADFGGGSIVGDPVLPPPSPVMIEVGTPRTHESTTPLSCGYFEINPTSLGYTPSAIELSVFFAVLDETHTGTVELYDVTNNVITNTFTLTGAGSTVMQKQTAALTVPTAETLYQVRCYVANSGESVEFGGAQVRILG